jgi:hypothetical protein
MFRAHHQHYDNICLSHVIASMTSKSSTNIFKLSEDSVDGYSASGCTVDDDSDDDNSDYDPDVDFDDLDDVEDPYNPKLASKSKVWAAHLKSDPLGRARKLISTLRSSDQCRLRFSKLINDGNKAGWFAKRDINGKCVQGETTQVLNRQLLRDVKTRWDSVFLMLEHLRELRPVSCVANMTAETS